MTPKLCGFWNNNDISKHEFNAAVRLKVEQTRAALERTSALFNLKLLDFCLIYMPVSRWPGMQNRQKFKSIFFVCSKSAKWSKIITKKFDVKLRQNITH